MVFLLVKVLPNLLNKSQAVFRKKVKMDKSYDLGELLQLHEKNHKSQPVQFNSVAVGEKLSLDTQNNKRRASRLTFPDNIRNITKSESLVLPKTDKKTKLEHRMEQLQLWKQEKERKKMEAALNKTKPFLVGVVHYPITLSFAPKNTTFNSTQNVVKLPLNTPSTDAKKGTSKLSLGLNTDNKTKSKALKSGSSKNNENDAQSKSSESSSIVDPSPPIVRKRVLRKRTETVLSKKISLTSESSGSLSSSSLEKTTTRKIHRNFETTSEDQNYCTPESSSSDNAHEQINTRTTIKSLARSSSDEADSKQNTPRIITTKFFQEEHKHQTIQKENHTEKYDKYTPEPIQKLSSPCVTMARGKDNARKEINEKNDEGLLDDGVYEVDTLDHCEQQLDSEIKRTTEMCTWNKLLQLVLPEAVKKTVLGAVDQARLLMLQNMQQIASLLMNTILSYLH